MKKLISLILSVAAVLTFCFTVNAEADESTLMSRFSKEASYSGAYLKDKVFYISTTDAAAFEKLREKLSKDDKYAGKALSAIVFTEVKYTYTELNDVIERVWKKAKELNIESSWTDPETNMAVFEVVNPDENSEAVLREMFDFENIQIEPIYREFVYAGKGWSEAVVKTEAKIRYDKDGKEYSGWAKTESGKRYYYKNGVRLTGVHKFKNGSAYVFDQNGLYLSKRNAGQYTVDFGGSYDVDIKDDKISFTISGFKDDAPSGNPYFSLYAYENGKWKLIPYNTGIFADYALGTNNGKMTFSQPLSMFYCDFKPGLYRIKAEVWEGKRDESGKPIDKAVFAEFNIIETLKEKQLEKAPQLELALVENEKTEQCLQAIQLTTSWSYTDENGNGIGYESDSPHALQLSDYNECTLQLQSINGNVLLSFSNDYTPKSVSVKRWNASYRTEDSISKSEPVEVVGSTIYIKNDKNDYIYEVYAKWEQGSSWYAFRIDSVLL